MPVSCILTVTAWQRPLPSAAAPGLYQCHWVSLGLTVSESDLPP